MKFLKTHIMQGLFLLGAIFLSFLAPIASHAYDLTDNDYLILDAVEDRLFGYMEGNPSITIEYIVTTIDGILENKRLSDRSYELLSVLADDMYYFGTLDGADEFYGNDNENFSDYYMLPEDCYEDEVYDSEDQRCYPRDNDYEGIDDNEDLIGDTHVHHHESQTESEKEGSYAIQSDDGITLLSGKEHVQHQEIWKLFSSLIPSAYRTDLLKVHFIRETNSDTYAYVNQSEESTDNREMTLNLGAFYPNGSEMDKKEVVYTLIHEYSHILTLNTSQVNHVAADISDVARQRYSDSCPTYFLPEGCLREGGYLKQFISAFWSEDDLAAVWGEQAENIYEKDKFVSDYASTNPGEDIAESFTHFILSRKPQGNSIKDQKISFFYQFGELVKLRDLIRSRL